MIDRRLEIAIFLAETELARLVEDRKEIGGNILAITDDRKTVWVVAESQSALVDRAHCITDFRWDGGHVHPGAFFQRRLGRKGHRGRNGLRSRQIGSLHT